MVIKDMKKSFVCEQCRFYAKINEQFGYCLNHNSHVYQRKVSYNYCCLTGKELSCYGKSVLYSPKKENSTFKLYKVYPFCADCKTKCADYSVLEKVRQKHSLKIYEGLVEFGCENKGYSLDFDKCRECSKKCDVNLAAALTKGLLLGKVGSGSIYEAFLKGEKI